MHLTHAILYAMVAFLAGSLLGMIGGICLFGAWLMGWIMPATVPEHLANNDTLAQAGTPRTAVKNEAAFAWADKYDFFRDDIGDVHYVAKEPEP